ncbi:uncharacterized protein LOC100265400 isoform X3 [Vitis vinifera]|uniref:uncharacterized protein LOC100265400 isoform X3 n=1 Tax=Vitis vinifera TaxID=29760 RepID=UPI0028830ACF|nr:uncharacterized protein LOC100265400 isoform X3 [Vitis vinifera]
MASNNNNSSSSGHIPVSEVYWSLVDKADKKFSKIRDLPYYQRNRYDTYFYKVFKVYTQLWKFQQENRQKLVEAGLKRWEIGEIASRIAQLYFGQYMRTSEAGYLSESYVFYEAILSREYFKEGLLQDLNLANKQLRFFARFMMVCLVLNRREMVHQLVSQLKMLVDECKRTFQVKFSELTLDTFRMLQCLEWEPSGSFYQSGGASLSGMGTKIGQNGSPGPSRINYSHDITDPTLPPNPRKAILYRPSITHFIAVLATICEELPPDGVLLIYLSGSGRGRQTIVPSYGAGTSLDTTENIVRSFQSHNIHSEANSTSPFRSPSDSPNPSSGQSKEDCISCHSGCLHIGSRGNGGLNFIYPCDLIPFTRRPLFLVIDSDSSEAFKGINGAEKGEPAALLLSPSSLSPPVAAVDTSRHPTGSLFTIFLTAPLQAFCLLLGFSGSDVEMDLYSKAEKLLSSSLNDWGLTLATSDTLDPAWAQILSDPFLRRILLRFIFCRAVLTLYAPTFNKKEFLPECLPCLPMAVHPTTTASQTMVLQIASIFSATNRFIFSEGIMLPEDTHSDRESISSS